MEDQIVAAVRRIMRAVDLHSRRLLERHGLTGPQLIVLREVAQRSSATICALAKAVHLSQPTVTGIVDRLERRNLIARRRDGADRRTVSVVVTSAGHELLSHDPSLAQDRFRDELTMLAQWEQTMMLATLQRIAAMMGADVLDVLPPNEGMLMTGDARAGTAAEVAAHPVLESGDENSPAPSGAGEVWNSC